MNTRMSHARAFVTVFVTFTGCPRTALAAGSEADQPDRASWQNVTPRPGIPARSRVCRGGMEVAGLSRIGTSCDSTVCPDGHPRGPPLAAPSPASGEECCEAAPTSPPSGQEQRPVTQLGPGLGPAGDGRRAAQALRVAQTTRPHPARACSSCSAKNRRSQSEV